MPQYACMYLEGPLGQCLCLLLQDVAIWNKMSSKPKRLRMELTGLDMENSATFTLCLAYLIFQEACVSSWISGLYKKGILLPNDLQVH